MGNNNVGKFAKALSRGVNEQQDPKADRTTATESPVHSTIKLITAACNASEPKMTLPSGKSPMYWGTAEIASRERNCPRFRQIAQRARDKDEVTLRSEEYKRGKKELCHMLLAGAYQRSCP